MLQFLINSITGKGGMGSLDMIWADDSVCWMKTVEKSFWKYSDCRLGLVLEKILQHLREILKVERVSSAKGCV